MIDENQTVAYLASDDSFFDLVQQMMKQQGVSAKKLCEGLCSTSMLSRIRQGKRMPNKMMRDRFLARLGISDERSENLLSYEDYVKWKVCRDIVKAVMRKEVMKARELLEKYAESEVFAGEIEQQFFYAMTVQLMLYENVSAEEVSECLEKAVKLTVPYIDEKRICDLQLSSQEMNLIVEYEKYKHPERLAERCEELLAYIENSAMDEPSKAKIYPKVAWYLCEVLCKEEEEAYPKIIKVSNRAVEYLRNTYKNYYLWELLSLRETILNKWIVQLEKTGKGKQAQALQSMYQENEEWKDAIGAVYDSINHFPYTENFCYLYMQQDVNCINEVMRRRRRMLGLSRAKLCEGICDEKTIVRMENDNFKTQIAVVKQLFERMKLSGELQRVDVVADCREARDLLEQLIKCANNFEVEKEQQTLLELERFLDMSIPLNQQFVKKGQAILLAGQDKSNRKQAFELLEEALACTIDFEMIQKSDRVYLTGGEIGCLYNMAVYAEKSIRNLYYTTLIKICEQYEKEDEVEEHISIYAWIMTSISHFLSNARQHERAISFAQKAMRESVLCGRLGHLAQNMNCISWNQQELQKKSTLSAEGCTRREGLKKCIALSGFCKDTFYENKYRKNLDPESHNSN